MRREIAVVVAAMVVLAGCRTAAIGPAAAHAGNGRVPRSSRWSPALLLRCGTSRPISTSDYGKATRAAVAESGAGGLKFNATANGLAVFPPRQVDGYMTVACRDSSGKELGRQCFELHVVIDTTTEGAAFLRFQDVPSGTSTVAAALTVSGRTARLATKEL